MKANLLILLVSFANVYSYSQTVGTTSAVSSSPGGLSLSQGSSGLSLTDVRSSVSKEWRMIFSKENVSYKAYNIPMTGLENEIIHLESLESTALKERDTIALMLIWARDFTLDKKKNELVYGKNPLPNYLSFRRMIETFTEIDNNTVFTSGYELFEEIKDDWKIEPLVRRKYFHTWRRKNGIWKLATKTTD